jgi:G3E family GTPase
MNISPKRDNIPFFLITGFLGSGKTTLLENILNEFSREKRIVVIQNEFAPTGTDGKHLKLGGNPFHLEEINNGSVFCICLLGTFRQTLEKVLNRHDPEMIFLETSGLSDPVNIMEILQDERFNNRLSPIRIISVIDALNFEKGLGIFPGFRHQIMVADTVIINKTDRVNIPDTIVKDKVRELNPFAGITETSWCQIDIRSLIVDEHDFQHKADAFNQTTSTRPAVNVCVMRAHQKISQPSLEIFLKTISQMTFVLKVMLILLMEPLWVFNRFSITGR